MVSGKPEIRRPRPGLAARVLRLGSRAPSRPEIGELGLDAFDLEPDRGVAGEGQRDIAARVLARLEADGEQRQHPIRGGRLQRLDLRAEHAVEAKRRPPPLDSLVGGGLAPPSPS